MDQVGIRSIRRASGGGMPILAERSGAMQTLCAALTMVAVAKAVTRSRG